MSKNEDLISIIMPAYNCEKYVEEAINSVLAQSYRNWELIVIDDGSVDNTRNIITEYLQNDFRISLLSNEKNIGVSAARNRGIDFAKGKWIAFLDSDDMWTPYKLEKQIEAVEENNAEFIFTGSSYINEEGKPYKGIFEVPEKVSYKRLKKQNVISCSSVLINKKYFINIKMEGNDMHEDYAVWLRILRTGITAYGVNEPLLIYRIHRNSRSWNKIKTINMTYKVFRFIGLNPVSSAYFMVRHVIGAIKKYKRIYGLTLHL
jgi:teichuronic acid biosynthesis glycosyltransferase TuaG